MNESKHKRETRPPYETVQTVVFGTTGSTFFTSEFWFDDIREPDGLESVLTPSVRSQAGRG